MNYTVSEYKHFLFLIFKNKKLGVLLSLANFVKAMVFLFSCRLVKTEVDPGELLETDFVEGDYPLLLNR